MSRKTQRRQGSPKRHPATFAYIHPGEVSSAFAFSMARMMVFEIGRTGTAPHVIAQKVGSGNIVKGRNEVVADFLRHESDWLVFCDSDMGFAHDAIAGLLLSADPASRPMVGGLCFGLKKGDDTDWELQADHYRMFPTIYRWVELDDEVGFQVVPDYPQDALVESAATGAAFFVVHRSVLEKIREKFGPVWFTPIQHPKRPDPFGEDLSFCIRVAGVDCPIFVNTAIKTSHDKGGIFLTERTWQDQQTLVELRK